MDENKKLKIWIVILSCLLVLFGCYVFYLEYDRGLNKITVESKEENKENAESKDNVSDNSDIQNLYSDLKGFYEGQVNAVIDGENVVVGTSLQLWDDGTFRIVQSYDVPGGYIGNYIIEKDKIILNALMETGSGTELRAAEGKIELKILNNSLIFKNINMEYMLSQEGTLKKTENEYEMNITINDTIESFLNDSAIYE